MINAIKRRLFIGLFFIVTAMATVGHLVYAYNVLLFAIPILFIIVMLTIFSESTRKRCMESIKASGSFKTKLGTKESCAWNFSIVFLLAAFEHWFLALLWLILWGAFYGLRSEAKGEQK